MTRVKLDKYFSAYNDGNFGGSNGLCFVINNISENSPKIKYQRKKES